jgi:carbon monoxide dehydrogenase subunit G
MATYFLSVSIHVNVPPEVAFAYVADLTRHSEWNPGLQVTAISEGATTVGSRFRSVGHMFGREFRDDLRITEYQPPVRFAFFVKGRVQHSHEFTFQPKDNGTLLTRTIGGQVSPLRKLLAPLLAALFVRREMTESVERLKARLEQLYPQAGTVT